MCYVGITVDTVKNSEDPKYFTSVMTGLCYHFYAIIILILPQRRAESSAAQRLEERLEAASELRRIGVHAQVLRRVQLRPRRE